MSKRIVLPFMILKSHWNTVVEHSNNTSYLFEEMAKKMIYEPRPLVIAPGRRVTIFSLVSEFKREFPMIRTSVYVNQELFHTLFDLYSSVSDKQFGVKLNVNCLMQTLYFYYCKENGLLIDKKYFDDHYFALKYTFNEKGCLKSYRELTDKLGSRPTLREWRKYRKEVHGPSESYIIDKFGSYSHFSELAAKRK